MYLPKLLYHLRGHKLDFLYQAFELLDASVLLALMKHMKGDASHGTNSESKTPSPSLGGGSKEDWPHLFSSIVSSLTAFLTNVSLKDHGEILDILIEAFSALAQYPPAGGPSLKSNDRTPQGWCVSMVGCVFLSTILFFQFWVNLACWIPCHVCARVAINVQSGLAVFQCITE